MNDTIRKSTKKFYAKRDVIDQMQHYVNHVAAMTAEGLHAKSDIAAELAHRDIEIESLQRRLDQRNEQIDGYERQLGIINADATITIGSEIERLQKRVARLELALNQIRNGCVDDDDTANELFRLCPSELRKIAVGALAGSTSEPPSERRAPIGDRMDAERWRALIGCARVTAMGSAGLVVQRDDGYAHLTVNLWTHGERETERYPREWLTQFVDIARASVAKSATMTELNAKFAGRKRGDDWGELTPRMSDETVTDRIPKDIGLREQEGECGSNPTERCTVPPPGWICTREPGHDGPCAALPDETSDSRLPFVFVEDPDMPPDQIELRSSTGQRVRIVNLKMPDGWCPGCRRILADDEIIGSCRNSGDGLHRRVTRSPEAKADASEAEQKCEQWNAIVAKGDPVSLLKDSGERIETRTRSTAYVCHSGYPVIFLEGVSGYYLLDRVTALGKAGNPS